MGFTAKRDAEAIARREAEKEAAVAAASGIP